MRSIDEHKIIQRILSGDVQAFEEIVKIYQDMVYTLSYRVLKNHEDAQEIAQDVFIKIFKSLDSFNMKSKLSTWIYRITYNTSINKLKSQKRKIVTTEINDKAEMKNSTASDALFEITNEEKKEIINITILKLPESERIIITLFYYEDLPISEIADIVGISKQNVKVKLFRSRQKLYIELKNLIGKQILDYEYN